MDRHDLVELTAQGRAKALASLQNTSGSGAVRLRHMIAGDDGTPLPGIIRRAANLLHNEIAIGFSSPFRINGERCRVTAVIDRSTIQCLISPYTLFSKLKATKKTARTPALQTLCSIKRTLANDNMMLGVWGSAALELYTGRRYTHDRSDLDLLLRGCSPSDIHRLTTAIDTIAASNGLSRVDIEVILPDNSAINAREYLTNAPTLLVKTQTSVGISERSVINSSLNSHL